MVLDFPTGGVLDQFVSALVLPPRAASVTLHRVPLVVAGKHRGGFATLLPLSSVQVLVSVWM